MTAPLPLLNAFLAGRYEVEREIGRGGMATVFLARDVRHQRAVALKVLNPELGAVLGSDRFLSEIRVTANLQHPNLLPLFDSGDANGLLYYVMPFVEGESLRQRLDREKQLPVDEALRIAAAVASALEYAHARGVIHRDLKPENILLQAGQPVVSDFGIALAVSNAGGTRVTQTGLSLGTPQYMSPEQATGDRAIDGRSDVYSLAAVTYEMLVGEPPHTGHTMQAVIARVLTERPRGVRTMRPSVSEQVELSIERGLEKLPADRWSTAREFADALQGKVPAVSSKTTAPRLAPNARSVSWRARSRDSIFLTVAAVAIAGIAMAIWSWGRTDRREAGLTVRVPVNIERPSGGLGDQLAISPNGKRIAYVEQLESGASVIVVRQVGQLKGRHLPGTERGLAPFFSADGEWIGFLKQGGRDLLKVAVSGGPPIQLAQVDGINGAVWTPDGMIVASIRDRLLIVPEAGGTLEPLIPRDTASGEAGQRNPRLLADGKTMLYLSWRSNFVESRIGVLSLATRTVRYVDLRGATPIGVLEGHLIYANATGSIMAVPFDLERVRLLGTPLPVIDEVDVSGFGNVRAALSHSGTLLYALGSPSTQIVRVDARGTGTVLVSEPRNYSGPRFSPDGKRLAFSIATNVDMHIWIYDIASSTLTRLTSDGTSNYRADWTPDGKKVLYLSNRGGRNELWWQNADFSGAVELVESMPGGNVSAGVFAPHDGRILAFWGSSPRHPVDILYRNLSGDTTRKPIAVTTAGEISPKFSRDGKWIAYASNQDGALQIYVQPFPPTGVRHKVTAAGGMTPVWSHDGKRIYYALGDRLRVATFRTIPEFAVTARDSLLSGNYLVTVPPHANFDISRDGDFVLLRPVDTGDELVVAHDWKYELRERTQLNRRP